MAKATRTWRLTRRGRFVVALAALLLISWLLNITTPEQCKVPVGEMSQFCIDFMFS